MQINTGLLRFRLGLALLGLAGLLCQGLATALTIPGYFTDPTLIVNFFSYFTILTNLGLTLWFGLAFRSLQQRHALWWGARPEIKGALLTAGSVTILVYWTLLVDIPIPTLIGKIANFLVHLLVPLGLWIDWLLVRDPMTKPYTHMLSAWLLFPLVYILYTEIRGPFAHWYPYFFLDPQVLGSIGAVALAIVGMLLLFLAVGSLIYWLYRKRGGLQLPSTSDATTEI